LLREVVSLTNINKTTAYRFLSHLESERYVFRDSNGYYMVGPRLAKFGNGASHQGALRRTSAEILEKLRIDTGETVNLAVLDRTELLYLSVFESKHTFRMVSEIGARRPLYCTALGKAILAYLPPAQQKEIVATIQFDQLTPQTIGSAEQLSADILKIRRRGYALDDEEAVVGARCISVPILTQTHAVIGAISISGPVVRITKRHVTEFATMLQAAAGEIARGLNVLFS
jgi:DNA-binding IclR family transcriptional regulator